MVVNRITTMGQRAGGGARSGGGGAGSMRTLTAADMTAAQKEVKSAQKSYDTLNKNYEKARKQYMADVHSGKLPGGAKSPKLEAYHDKINKAYGRLETAKSLLAAKTKAYKAGKKFDANKLDLPF